MESKRSRIHLEVNLMAYAAATCFVSRSCWY